MPYTNPVMQTLNRGAAVAQQGLGSAARSMSAAAMMMDKGFSLPLKIDALLHEEEQAKLNQMKNISDMTRQAYMDSLREQQMKFNQDLAMKKEARAEKLAPYQLQQAQNQALLGQKKVDSYDEDKALEREKIKKNMSLTDAQIKNYLAKANQTNQEVETLKTLGSASTGGTTLAGNLINNEKYQSADVPTKRNYLDQTKRKLREALAKAGSNKVAKNYLQEQIRIVDDERKKLAVDPGSIAEVITPEIIRTKGNLTESQLNKKISEYARKNNLNKEEKEKLYKLAKKQVADYKKRIDDRRKIYGEYIAKSEATKGRDEYYINDTAAMLGSLIPNLKPMIDKGFEDSDSFFSPVLNLSIFDKGIAGIADNEGIATGIYQQLKTNPRIFKLFLGDDYTELDLEDKNEDELLDIMKKRFKDETFRKQLKNEFYKFN